MWCLKLGALKAAGRADSECGAVGRGRTLAELQKEFPDEARCAAFLSARRWPDGFVCPGCGRGRAVALKSRPRLLECLDCGRLLAQKLRRSMVDPDRDLLEGVVEVDQTELPFRAG